MRWLGTITDSMDVNLSKLRGIVRMRETAELQSVGSQRVELDLAIKQNSSVQFSHSVMSDSMTPRTAAWQGFPVHHQLPELAQTHVHQVNDAIQPSHPVSPPSPPAFNISQHQVFSCELVLCIRWLKYWSFSFSISLSNEYSGLISLWTGWISLQSKGLSRVFSNTTVQKHKLFGAQLSLYSNSHIHTWPLEKP